MLTHINIVSVIYLSLVRPHLEYAAVVWDPKQQRDINLLENVHKFALRLCTKRWDLPYDVLCCLCQIPTLSSRCRFLKLYAIYTILHNLCYFPPNIFTLNKCTISRHSHPQAYFSHFHEHSRTWTHMSQVQSNYGTASHERQCMLCDSLYSFKKNYYSIITSYIYDHIFILRVHTCISNI